MICRSASAAASPSHFGGLRGGSSVVLRIASRAVDASHQSAFPLRRASQNQVHPLPRRTRASLGGPPRHDRVGVATVTISERSRTALPLAIPAGSLAFPAPPRIARQVAPARA